MFQEHAFPVQVANVSKCSNIVFFFHKVRTDTASNQTVKGLSQYCALFKACLY